MWYIISLRLYISEPGSCSDDYNQPIEAKVLVLHLFMTFNKIIKKSVDINQRFAFDSTKV